MLQNKNKPKGEIIKMLKKVTITTALSAALLFGGAMQTSVDASASTDSPHQQGNISHHNDSPLSGNRNIYRGNIQDFLTQFFNRYRGDWHTSEKQKANDNTNSNQTTNKERVQAPQKTEQNQNNGSNQVAQTKEQSSDSDEGQLNAYEQEVVSLTNDERVSRGLEPLKVDAELSIVARDKSDDMRSGRYFAHNSPTYGSPFDMMESYGITYQTAGENIARGQRSPEEVVNGWMNSEGHRANILNPNFTHIGVGYIDQGNYWTQEFTG